MPIPIPSPPALPLLPPGKGLGLLWGPEHPLYSVTRQLIKTFLSTWPLLCGGYLPTSETDYKSEPKPECKCHVTMHKDCFCIISWLLIIFGRDDTGNSILLTLDSVSSQSLCWFQTCDQLPKCWKERQALSCPAWLHFSSDKSQPHLRRHRIDD